MTQAWSKALMVSGVVLAILMIIFYAIPYQQAVNEAGQLTVTNSKELIR